MADNVTEEILTVDELCEILRIGKTAAYELLRSGKLHSFRIKRKWFISREAIRKYVREQSNL